MNNSTLRWSRWMANADVEVNVDEDVDADAAVTAFGSV